MAQTLKDLVKKNKKYVKEDFNLNELIDKFLQAKNLESKHSSYFHPSLISHGIECQLWWYFFLRDTERVPSNFSDENLTAMMVGSGIHDQLQKTLWEMGLLEGVWECNSCGFTFWATSPKNQCDECRRFFKSWDYLTFKEVPIHVGFIRGHADGFINNQGRRTLAEFKSIKNVDRPNATYGFEKLLEKPLDEHFLQTQLYLDGWYEIAKNAPLGHEIVLADGGKLVLEKLDTPVHYGARIIGPVDYGIIEYVAKNTSEKKSYLIKRNQNSIQFLKDEMQLIWKAYLEETSEILKGPSKNSNKCKKCPYKGVCSWT